VLCSQKKLLALYEEVSGQTVNIGKCSIVFSPKTKKEDEDDADSGYRKRSSK
jgi:hypothetical protein